MTNNLISRQAAIDAAKEAYENDELFEGYEYRIRELPSAQLEREKGKWMPHKEKSREYIGGLLAYIGYDYWFCDACGYRVETGQPMYNFCPNCGADMRCSEKSNS